MRTRHVSALVVLLWAAAGWSSVASAQSNLGAPIIGGGGDCSGITAGTGSCGPYVTESAYVAGGEVSSSVSVNPATNIFDGSGSVHNTWQFEVLGASGNATLQLNTIASTAIVLTGGAPPPLDGGGSAEAEVVLVNPAVGTPILDEHACSSFFYGCQLGVAPSAGPSLAINDYTFTVFTNTVYDLATVLFYYDVNGATLTVSIDPNITFAPTFNSKGYSLIYSADTVAPTPAPTAAPEIDPASSASGLTLLLGSLLVLRGRSTKLNSAAA